MERPTLTVQTEERTRERNLNQDPFSEFEWSRRDAVIKGADGVVVFEQLSVEAPVVWSDTAVNVVASKYFRGNIGEEDREDSIRDLVARVAETISTWALEDGYLIGGIERREFRNDLVRLILSQSLAFNTPVWLNVGIDEEPQCSACYISSVDDSLDSIMDFAATEAKIFQRGGGSGANLSKLRSSNELLSNGGVASGPVSFMKGFDSFAGVIKSGGRMRRAAKMVVLNIDHPDIRTFVRSKLGEEEKARALVAAGYDGGIDGDVYSGVFFQNANHSVRVTDAFFAAVEADEVWETIGVTTGCVAESVPARELLREISEAAWACGDPGLQFDDAANRWHTCPSSGRINGSNPCSEFMFLDDSACNLASLNLRKFQTVSGRLDVVSFRAAIDVAVTAQDVIVGRAKYPTDEIGLNARRFRPLGLGYANLGAFLMAAGLPYDSDEGRGVAAAITALMTSRAYRWSAEIARRMGPFDKFDANRDSVLGVLDRHWDATEDLPMNSDGRGPVAEAAREDLLAARQEAARSGVRNAQVTVLAPTGTIAFMMDCDTTGIEPDYALVKTKALVGGGTLSSVNGTVRDALRRLGKSEKNVETLVEVLKRDGTLSNGHLERKYLPIFDCAAVDVDGRSISVDGHLGMMAAVQPFLSGAISKTVNLPNEATVEDVERAFKRAYELDLKAIAVYRDRCKAVQPLEAKKPKNGNGKNGNGRLAELEVGAVTSTREKLPDECRTIRQKLDIAGSFDGYVHAGLYPDGRVGEVFIRLAKEGSTIRGLADSLATAVSIGLQYGVPLDVFVEKFSHWRFEPSGFTTDKRIGYANSIVDYVFRWIGIRFPNGRDATPEKVAAEALRRRPTAEFKVLARTPDAPFCPNCSTQLRRNGTCYVCPTCGTTTGCS